MCKVESRDQFLRMVSQWIPVNPICVEIGILNGDFSQMILDELKPKHLILVDPFETDDSKKYQDGTPTAYSTEDNYNHILSRFEKEALAAIIIIIKEYSYKAFADPINKEFEDAINKACDFIYIDASHLYEHVKRDLNDWLPKLKPNGLMCLHDYIDLADFGVIRAADEFCIEHNFQIIIHNTNGGDVALKRKNV